MDGSPTLSLLPGPDIVKNGHTPDCPSDRTESVNHHCLVKKKAVSQPPPPPNLPDQPEIECDELWSFVGNKDHQVWLWLAIERTTGLIVAWVCGDRSEHSARLVWEALPRHVRHHAQFYTDGWGAYQNVFPCTRHWICPNGSGGTSRVEGRNATLRQRISALVRCTGSFSRDLLLHRFGFNWSLII